MGEMSSRSLGRFLLALILTFWAGTALADKRVALIIGNSQYTSDKLRLKTPANDAQDLAASLITRSPNSRTRRRMRILLRR